MNYVLTGYMGAGKTTVGKRLAACTGMQFLDTDELIVSKTGLSINNIFDKFGENYFRELETGTVEELINTARDCVISCGGGLPVREENRQLLKKLGTVIYLNVNEADIMKRLENDTERPLLKGPEDEVKDRIREMLKIRDPIYRECADVIINTGDMPIEDVISTICSVNA